MQETAKDSPLGESARPFRQPNRWYKGQIAHCLCGFSADVAKQWNVVASTTGTKPRLQLPDGEEHRCTKAQLIRRKRGPRPKPPRPPTASLSLTFPAVDLEKMRALHGDHLNKQAARIVARVLLGKESEPCPPLWTERFCLVSRMRGTVKTADPLEVGVGRRDPR